MSYDEFIYKNDVFPSIEMNHIHTKDESSVNNDKEVENIFPPTTLNISDNSCNPCLDDCYERKKQVRFPEENKIVSDYFEARNYWQEPRFCSCEELINSYKKACDIYNIKPIPILLEQIKGIDVGLCNERYDMLNLSNVKLDLKQVESMEEIFKRVQFKTLNFENTTLDDESASSLFEIIEYYESCLKLNLSHNGKISYIGFNACSKMLKKTPCLDTIELKGIIFTDTTIPPLNRALRCGSNLKVLHLENSNICSKNLLILSSALKLNIHLRELHLSGNRMVPSDGIQLGSLLKVNRLLETLDVRNNSLGDVGLSHICDGLSDQSQPHSNRSETENQGQGLVCLILWSNSITYNGMPSMSDALKSTKSLQSLNLGNNPISSEGVHYLREGLLSNRTLLRLSLPCCRITCEGGVAIAEYLADTKQLLRLDIRDNDIRTAGLMAISLSMKVNKSLTRLDVDSNPKKDPNVKGFFETQTESLKIIQQRVQDNKKVMLEKQDMELSQSFLSLSIQTQDIVDVVSDINSNLTVLDDLTSSKPCIEHTNASLSTNGIDPLNDTTYDVTKVPMSLDLSPDTDSSITFLGNFANKVLSPTDTILDIDIEPAFIIKNKKDSVTVLNCNLPTINFVGDIESVSEIKMSSSSTENNTDNLFDQTLPDNYIMTSDLLNIDSYSIKDHIKNQSLIASETDNNKQFFIHDSTTGNVDKLNPENVTESIQVGVEIISENVESSDKIRVEKNTIDTSMDDSVELVNSSQIIEFLAGSNDLPQEPLIEDLIITDNVSAVNTAEL